MVMLLLFASSLKPVYRPSTEACCLPRAFSRFPAVMDKAVEDCIASIHSAEAGDPSVEVKVKLLHDFVATSLPKSRHQVLMDASSTLVLSVHHHNPTMRRAAVNQLGKRLGAKGKVCWVGIPQVPPLICSSLLPPLSSFLFNPSFLSMNSSSSPLLHDPPLSLPFLPPPLPGNRHL